MVSAWYVLTMLALAWLSGGLIAYVAWCRDGRPRRSSTLVDAWAAKALTDAKPRHRPPPRAPSPATFRVGPAPTFGELEVDDTLTAPLEPTPTPPLASLGIRGHRMDAPNGPECACGKPSRHQSGWCMQQDVKLCCGYSTTAPLEPPPGDA